ncbi:MAG: hypothetical protein U9R57_03570 [Thermodesulfobacteriota bacterium]|nr:hypothetical protein [Thermodesulfobacteriota bacterium]
MMYQTGSWYFLGFAIISLVPFVVCVRPVIENRSITVGDGSITVHQRFCKPLKLTLVEDLYQIVLKDEAVRSFCFQYGDNKSIQISPVAYQDGNELTETILEQIEQRKLVLEMVSA